MKCPNCTNLHDSLKEKLSITRKCPIECSECRTKFFIKRPFSFWISDFLWKAGAIYIPLILAFITWSWTGVIVIILISLTLWLVLAYYEGISQPTIEITKEMERLSKKYYSIFIWVFIFAILIFFYSPRIFY